MSAVSQPHRSLAKTAFLWALPILAIGSAHAQGLTDAIPAIRSAELLGGGNANQMTPYLRTLLGLSMISLLPAILMAMTSFTRIIITLSFVRHAIGLPETPPNPVLIVLALFMTVFTMAPTLDQVQKDAYTPFMDGKITLRDAASAGTQPFKDFMAQHVKEQDLELVSSLSHKPLPPKAQDVDLTLLVPAFMLSELRTAFAVGFMIFLPFMLIDLIVSAILMSLGMMMMPPATVALPLKLLLFVLIDGWTLVLNAIAGSYQ